MWVKSITFRHVPNNGMYKGPQWRYLGTSIQGYNHKEALVYTFKTTGNFPRASSIIAYGGIRVGSYVVRFAG